MQNKKTLATWKGATIYWVVSFLVANIVIAIFTISVYSLFPNLKIDVMDKSLLVDGSKIVQSFVYLLIFLFGYIVGCYTIAKWLVGRYDFENAKAVVFYAVFSEAILIILLSPPLNSAILFIAGLIVTQLVGSKVLTGSFRLRYNAFR
jgi:hypothetical protein